MTSRVKKKRQRLGDKTNSYLIFMKDIDLDLSSVYLFALLNPSHQHSFSSFSISGILRKRRKISKMFFFRSPSLFLVIVNSSRTRMNCQTLLVVVWNHEFFYFSAAVTDDERRGFFLKINDAKLYSEMHKNSAWWNRVGWSASSRGKCLNPFLVATHFVPYLSQLLAPTFHGSFSTAHSL